MTVGDGGKFRLTDQKFAQGIALGHELSGIEFKSPGPLSEGRLVAQAVKAIPGLANRRDGGSVIIGVSEQDGRQRLGFGSRPGFVSAFRRAAQAAVSCGICS